MAITFNNFASHFDNRSTSPDMSTKELLEAESSSPKSEDPSPRSEDPSSPLPEFDDSSSDTCTFDLVPSRCMSPDIFKEGSFKSEGPSPKAREPALEAPIWETERKADTINWKSMEKRNEQGGLSILLRRKRFLKAMTQTFDYCYEKRLGEERKYPIGSQKSEERLAQARRMDLLAAETESAYWSVNRVIAVHMSYT